MANDEIEALARAMRQHARKLEDLRDQGEDLARQLKALQEAGKSAKGKGEDDDGNPF